MVLLTSTSDKIQVISGSAGALDVHASWVDNASGTITPGRTNTASIVTATTTDVVASPGASTQRNVKFLCVFNTHATVGNAIEVQHTDGTTIESLWKGTLAAGESVTLDANGDWTYYDAAGAIKINAVPGRFVALSVKTSGTSFTTGLTTNLLHVICIGGGGGGGNSTGNATQTAVASGGGSSGVCEKWFVVSPNTAYTYAVGGSGAAGAAGGNSTFAVGATTITAIGGAAGVAATQTNATVFHLPGGAGGAISTNGDINGAGMPGYPAMRAPGTAAIAANTFYSGGGGSTVYGGGGVGSGTAGNGAAGTGYGSGGAGGLSNTAGANNGGAGAAGAVIIEEYT